MRVATGRAAGAARTGAAVATLAGAARTGAAAATFACVVAAGAAWVGVACATVAGLAIGAALATLAGLAGFATVATFAAAGFAAVDAVVAIAGAATSASAATLSPIMVLNFVITSFLFVLGATPVSYNVEARIIPIIGLSPFYKWSDAVDCLDEPSIAEPIQPGGVGTITRSSCCNYFCNDCRLERKGQCAAIMSPVRAPIKVVGEVPQ